ncbi:CPBP family intramembrane glutamic endopeptidase [Massilia putida]|uniref:CPBP family intramembrane glutamic endopeptidase n=1 Tax=Massilia putida TaxID=1141883 RepID=UPI0009FAC700|nr:CPBP family intramembrane glutamic endopeptidase [Massilia putida]
MLLDPHVAPAFGALALAVLLLWCPAPAVRGNRDWAWVAGLLVACAVGKASDVLDGRGLAAIFFYLALAFGAGTSERAWLRIPLLVLTGVFALLLALHRLPGFYNPVLADHVQVSAGAIPFTLYANFDKAVAGIVLMGVFCAPIRMRADWLPMLRRALPVLLATLVVVLGAGMALGVVRPDVKWTALTPWFLANNLLITCVTEEAFFRGFLLGGMAHGMARWRYGTAVAVVVSTVLFGLVHWPGGPLLVVFATLAGLGNAAAYLRSGRIEGAILTHFALNAAHFIAFTYPALTH